MGGGGRRRVTEKYASCKALKGKEFFRIMEEGNDKQRDLAV